MKKTFTIILFLIAKFSFSQNLVPNPSFEQYDTCPSALITNAVGWSIYKGSPDYFNSCNNTSLIRYGIPSNEWGFQYARSGNAYAGLCTLDTITFFREYIGIQLSDSLSIGQKYFASFYVNKAVNSPYFLSNPSYGNVMTNKIGLRLSTIAYINANEPTDNYAQIYTDSIITDTTNWVKISGSFIADSAYKYLSIGNFFTDSATRYITSDSSAVLAYYYIDDVCISTDSLTCNSTTDGIIYYNSNSVQIFPNPARDWIVLEGRGIFKLSIYNVVGKLCFSNDVLPSSLLNKVDVSNLSKGIYFLYIKTTKENVIQKLIIE